MSFKVWLAKVLDVPPVEKVIYNGLPRDVIKYQLVEVPALRTQTGWNKELKEAVIALSVHPGFQALTDKLALQSATLKSKLWSSRHKEIRDVEFLQSGIFWCEWLQNQITATTTAVNRSTVYRRDAAEEDINAIKEIEATYNLGGGDSQ